VFRRVYKRLLEIKEEFKKEPPLNLLLFKEENFSLLTIVIGIKG